MYLFVLLSKYAIITFPRDVCVLITLTLDLLIGLEISFICPILQYLLFRQSKYVILNEAYIQSEDGTNEFSQLYVSTFDWNKYYLLDPIP